MSTTTFRTLTDTILSGQFFLVALFTLVVYKMFYNRFISPLRKLPSVYFIELWQIRLIIGGLRNTFFLHMAEVHRKYGFILRTGPNTISVCDPSAVKTIYSSSKFRKNELYKSFDLGANNIFATREPAFHKIRKRAIAPAYSQSALDAIEPDISRVGMLQLRNILDQAANSGQTVDLLELLQHMTLDVTGEIAFGKSFGMLHNANHPINHWMEDTAMDGIAQIAFGRLAPLYQIKFADGTQKLRKFAQEALNRRRAEGSSRKDTLQWLLEAADADTEGNFPEEDLLAETIVQLIAGTDTTALTLVWTLHLLFENPECLNKLVEELDRTLPSDSQEIKYKDVRDLPYLEAVLNESMRLRPIANVLPRVVPEGGADIGGYFVPGGTDIFLCVFGLHTHPDVWPDAFKFAPERWMQDAERIAEMRKAFMPFSIGQRACIGRLLAWMEMKLTVAMLFRRFEFSTIPGFDMSPSARFITKPACGKLPATVRRRTQTAGTSV